MMKHWKILAAASLIAFAMNTSFADGIKSGAPSGWQLWGPLGDKYEMGIDPAESTQGHPALVIASKDTPTNETVSLMQQVDGTEWEGGVIEFSMMAKAVGADKNRVWLRHLRSRDILPDSLQNKANVFSQPRSAPELVLHARSIPDGKDWERITLSSYFPKGSDLREKHFDIGVSLASKGKIWIKDIKLERKPYVAVPAPVELPGFRSGLPAYPARNLNFTE